MKSSRKSLTTMENNLFSASIIILTSIMFTFITMWNASIALVSILFMIVMFILYSASCYSQRLFNILICLLVLNFVVLLVNTL